MIEQGNFSKIESGNFTAFIFQNEPCSICFDHSDLEIVELIFNRLDGIDIDLIYGIFQALEGKHLTPDNWMKLIDTIKSFDPDKGEI